MDSPDINQQPASSIGAQFLTANGGAPAASQDEANATPTSGQPSSAPAQAAPAPPSPEQQAEVAQTAKHTAIGRLFHTLATGGTGSSASNFWRTVVGGAFAGIGAANDAPVTARGPYGDVRDKSMGGAASRGFAAGMGLAQQQQDRQRQQAQQQKEEQRRDQESKIQLDDSVLRKQADARAQQASIQNSVEHEKRMKQLDQNIAAGDWEQGQRAAKAAQDQVNFFNSLQEAGAQPLSGAEGEPLQFSTHEEAEKAAHDNPKFWIGNFKTRTAYDPGTGKYGVYRVPDTDLKNVQLKDQQGNVHTIPRMSPSDFLDFQVRQQNLTKGALSIDEAKVRLAQIREDRKSSSAYGKALAELDKVDGDADKLSPSSRTLLYSTASKNLGDAIRAKTAADKAEDADAQEAANAAIKHYSGVLSGLHGNKPNAAQDGTPKADVQPGAARYTLQGHSIDVKIGSDQETQILKQYPQLKPQAAGVPAGQVAVYGPDGFRTFLPKSGLAAAKERDAQAGRTGLTYIPGPDAPSAQTNNNSNTASSAGLQ
jgi:hypothetical protein